MSFSVKKITRISALIFLLTALLLIGALTDTIYRWLDDFYANLFAEGGLLHFLQASQTNVDQSITKRSWTTMLSFGLLYTGLSMLFLHVYFADLRKTKVVVGLYGLVFFFCAVLIVVGKLSNVLQANQLSRHLIELIVSPFPIVLLIPALSFLFSAKKPTVQN